jgi:hypothetical protein
VHAPDWSRGRTLSSRARGDTTDSHSPLQRLLDVIPTCTANVRGAHDGYRFGLTIGMFSARNNAR